MAGSTTRRAGHLPPASLDAACYAADANTKPDGSPTHHRLASPSPCIRTRRGHDYRETHGGEVASSSVKRGLEKGQARLPVRADFMKHSATPQNIRLETTRHPSLLDRRGAVSDWRDPKAENEVYDQNWPNDTVSSRISSGSNHGAVKPSATPQKIRLQTARNPSLLDMRVEGSNQLPSRSTHNAAPARLTHLSHTYNCHQHLGATDAINEGILHKEKGQVRLPSRADFMKPSATPQNKRLETTRHPSLLERTGAVSDGKAPKASGKDLEVYDQNYCQNDTVSSSRISSAERNRSSDDYKPLEEKGQARLPVRADFMKHSATPQNIKLETTRHPSLLDRRGAVSDWRVPMPIGKDNEVYDQNNFENDTVSSSLISSAERNHSSDDHKPLEDSRLTHSKSSCTSPGSADSRVWEEEPYMNTLGPGGGYGYPHPPPFCRCDLCTKETALYRLRCCLLIVCQRCACSCEPAEGAEEAMQARKEELPKVKLEGSDLFLWQPCSFPAQLMLCLAKRSGNHLKYYFAHIVDLMDSENEMISSTVYNFRQQGYHATSLTVTV